MVTVDCSQRNSSLKQVKTVSAFYWRLRDVTKPTTNCLAGMQRPLVSTPILDIDRSSSCGMKTTAGFGRSTNFHDDFHSYTYLFVNLSYHSVQMKLSFNNKLIQLMLKCGIQSEAIPLHAMEGAWGEKRFNHWMKLKQNLMDFIKW
jgi:hypothetical protein